MTSLVNPLPPVARSKSAALVSADLWLAVALIVVALIVWFGSLHLIDVRKMNDLGLVSVMPVFSYAALFLMILSFVLTLRGSLTPLREGVLYASVIVIIVMLYGLNSFVEEQTRFAVTWLHAGFVESIMRTGKLAFNLDARFNWPGFFSGSALLTQAAGLSNPIGFAGWAPLVFNLMYLPPMKLILQTLTKDQRIVWTSIWLFYLLNWISQDYYSPQGLNFFFYLAMLALILRWFKGSGIVPLTLITRLNLPRRFRFLARRRIAGLFTWIGGLFDSPDIPDLEGSKLQRVGLIFIAITLFIAIATSHQLTPVAVIIALCALVVFNRCSLRSLPILFGVITVGWISYMTVSYLSGHLADVIGGLGGLLGSVGANVTGRIKGSSQHQIILFMRLAMTGAIWVLAGLGALRRLTTGRLDLTCLLLMAAPFPIIGLNSYGGEALLRVYLFALPFTAFLSAALIFPRIETRTTWLTLAALGALSVLLLAGFLFTRYGNERMDYMTTDEVAGVDYVYSVAPIGSRIVVSSPNLPAPYKDVELYNFSPNMDEFYQSDVPAIIADMSKKPGTPTYLLLTRSQKAYGELFYGVTPGWGDRLISALLATNKFKVLYSNPDAIVMVLAAIPS